MLLIVIVSLALVKLLKGTSDSGSRGSVSVCA